MKNIVFLLPFLALILACSENCESDNPVCQEQPQTGVVCQAHFENWFYDDASNTCSKISYSGCESVGFLTEAACLECICND